MVHSLVGTVMVRQQLYGYLPPISKTIQIQRTKHTEHYRRSKNELLGNVLQWTPTHGRTDVEWPTKTYLQQLCIDTRYSPEDQPKLIDDIYIYRERERVREIRASDTIWWWYLRKFWGRSADVYRKDIAIYRDYKNIMQKVYIHVQTTTTTTTTGNKSANLE